jgi:hypothetical protein
VILDEQGRDGAVSEEVTPRRDPEQCLLAVRRLHALGYTDRQMAGRLLLSRNTVMKYRLLAGLAANKRSGRTRGEKDRDNMLRTLRRDVCAVEAARLGWPQAGCRSEAVVLAALEGGPLTLRQVVEVTRSSFNTVRDAKVRLVRAGLICRAGKRNNPRGSFAWLWALAPGVRRHQTHRPLRERRLPA